MELIGEKVSWHWQENHKSAMMISGVALIQKQEGKLICLVPIGKQLPLFCPKKKLVNSIYFCWWLRRWCWRKSYPKSYTHWAGISQSIAACVRWVSLACPKLPQLTLPSVPMPRCNHNIHLARVMCSWDEKNLKSQTCCEALLFLRRWRTIH